MRKDGETMNDEEVSTKCSGVQDTPDTNSGWTLKCSQHFTGTTDSLTSGEICLYSMIISYQKST